jgi:hypothetical protein
MPVVVDYNSASSEIEAWYLTDQPYEAIVTTKTPDEVNTGPAKVAPKKITTKPKVIESQVITTKSSLPAASVLSVATPNLKQADRSSSNNTNSIMLVFGGVLSGLLLGRGSRLKQIMR